MSAFVVSREHIDALVTAALDATPRRVGAPIAWYWPAIDRAEDNTATLRAKRYEARREEASRIGAMLWATNVHSVNHRYDEDDWEDVYEYRRHPFDLSPVAILKAIDCYEYQSCEHDDWPTSEAHAFCQALRRAYIHLLPGYDTADWGIWGTDE
jgi:hypothetical protein